MATPECWTSTWAETEKRTSPWAFSFQENLPQTARRNRTIQSIHLQASLLRWVHTSLYAMVITGPLQTLARNYRVRDGEAIYSPLLGGSVRMSVANEETLEFPIKRQNAYIFLLSASLSTWHSPWVKQAVEEEGGTCCWRKMGSKRRDWVGWEGWRTYRPSLQTDATINKATVRWKSTVKWAPI